MPGRRRSTKKKVEMAILPSGKMVKMDAKYFAEWNQFIALLGHAVEGEVIGFDPTVLIQDTRTGKAYSVPLNVARRIVNLYEKANKINGHANDQGDPQA